jgi:endonuclease YncB( thermonuclease family)
MIRSVLLGVLVSVIPGLALAAEISGVPKLRDGDYVTIGATRIRLAGIDAPALDQLCLNAKGERWTCGFAARDALFARAGDKSWTCTPTRTDRFGRVVAKCLVDGEDIQAWMVRSGWALAYVQYSKAYENDEKDARTALAGLWAGAFVAPWDWRVRDRKTTVLGNVRVPDSARPMLFASASGPVAPSPECTIKGNVNRSGVCIYHKPTSRWYAKITMRVSKGTRWFCSVEEAEAAGCRETRR